MESFPAPAGPAPVSHLMRSVQESLSHELAALLELDAHVAAQFEALRLRDAAALEPAAHSAAEAVHALERATQTRERQVRLLQRVAGREGASLGEILDGTASGARDDAWHGLHTAYETLREQAAHTRGRCETLDQTLQFALRLSREMVRALHEVSAAPALRVYTSGGAAAHAPAAPHSLLNRIG